MKLGRNSKACSACPVLRKYYVNGGCVAVSQKPKLLNLK